MSVIKFGKIVYFIQRSFISKPNNYDKAYIATFPGAFLLELLHWMIFQHGFDVLFGMKLFQHCIRIFWDITWSQRIKICVGAIFRIDVNHAPVVFIHKPGDKNMGCVEIDFLYSNY